MDITEFAKESEIRTKSLPLGDTQNPGQFTFYTL